MTLKYYDAFGKKTPKQSFVDGLQANINDRFDVAPNVFTIEEESVFGTLSFSNIEVRIDHIISSETGQRQGDDYRKLTFKDGISNPINGKRYRFVNNIWLTVNTKNYEYYTYTSTIIRCNNTINWILDNGSIHKEPIAFNNKLSATGFEINKSVDIAGGTIFGAVQYNEYTSQLEVDDRFIIGAGGGIQAYSIKSINSIALQETYADEPQLLMIEFEISEYNKDIDDLDNRVSYQKDILYSIAIDQGDVSNVVGFNTNLSATIKLNDAIISGNVVWESSDPSVVSVDANTGLITLLQTGSSAVITAKIEDNDNISDSINVDVLSAPVSEYEARIIPNNTVILQGKSSTYNVYVYDQDNNIVSGSFAITASNVPNDSYKLTIISGNEFIVENIEQYTDNELLINCVSGLANTSISIDLRGVW